jgi:hypothetical protein
MKNALVRCIQLLFVTLVAGYALSAHADYKSTYESIEWNKRGNHDFYCIDIVDANVVKDLKQQANPWLQAVKCGQSLYSFSPRNHFEQMVKNGIRDRHLSPGQKFGWRVYSNSSITHEWNYGGDSYDGVVEVTKKCTDDRDNLPYVADNTSAQWGCRNDDDYYTIDILNADGSVRIQDYCHQSGKKCDTDNLHKFDLTKLELPVGSYQWKIWSPSAGNPGGTNFEGKFTVTASSVGKVLFSANCTECHKDTKDKGAGGGANPAVIKDAISLDRGGMGKLKLTNEQLQQIAEYIKEMNK